uniref:Anterior gradient 3, protein disulphide isomerase family member n=1 Tax=Callithrix jacchus TaxID=9483 RepID=A0A5F4WED5_CALJA
MCINPHPFLTRNIQNTFPTRAVAKSASSERVSRRHDATLSFSSLPITRHSFFQPCHCNKKGKEASSDTLKSKKPLMVIHHLEDCQYSQGLKRVFAQNEEIQEMAQNKFIMLNLMHETTDKNLSPDGQYVPRIMFVDPSLTVRADITGRYSNRLYTYEPQDLPLLIENMKKALRLIQIEL